MTRSALPRLALVGVCLAVLLGLFVAAGAGLALSDPQERTAGETTTVTGTVVSEEPPTIALADGQQFILEDHPADSVSMGDRLAVDVTVRAAGTPRGDIAASPLEDAFMYSVSALAGLLVLGLAIDRWRFDVRRLRVEPRDVALHERLRDRRRSPANHASVPTETDPNLDQGETRG